MGRKKNTLEQRSAKMTARRRYHYDDQTPFIELFKPEYQRWLIVGGIASELKTLLRNGDSINIRTMTYLDFRLTRDESDDRPPCTPTQIYRWFAKLLIKTGSSGTKYGKNMIYRYITDWHSNLFVDELYLKTSIDKEITRILLTDFKNHSTKK